MDEMGQVSGSGWAVGSIGGVVCLLFILPPIILTKNNPALNCWSCAYIHFAALFFAACASLVFLR